MSGYWAIGRPCSATRPSRTVTMEMTIATMGRLMKNSAIGPSAPRWPAVARAGSATGSGSTCMPARRRWSPAEDQPVTGLHALLDQPVAADRGARSRRRGPPPCCPCRARRPGSGPAARVTARWGTSTAPLRCSVAARTRAKRPGRSRRSGIRERLLPAAGCPWSDPRPGPWRSRARAAGRRRRRPGRAAAGLPLASPSGFTSPPNRRV